jgi:ABC-type glycerol-3-phosphate transport system substrate-binding protein
MTGHLPDAGERAYLLTLKSTFGSRYKNWGLDSIVDVAISPAMHELYLDDFPSAWRDEALRRRLAVVGPTDYFYKWNGDEFIHFADTPLAYLLDRVDPRYVTAAILDGRPAGLPLAGGNHQLLFINRRHTDVVPDTFDELLREAWRLREERSMLWPFVYPTNACYFLFPLLYGFHAPLWSDQARPGVGITRDALYRVLELHKELMYDRIILPVKWEQYHSVFEFQTGRAAFCFGGDWDIASHQAVIGDDLIVTSIPRLERECRSTANCSYLFLTRAMTSSAIESAGRAAELLLGDEVQRDLMDTLYRVPTRRYLADSNPTTAGANDANIQRSRGVFSRAIFLPPDRVVSHIFHVLGDLFEPGVLVKYPIGDLADRAHEKMLDPDSTIPIR